MKRRIMSIALAVCLATAAAIYAGDGFAMKCQPQPKETPTAGASKTLCVKCQAAEKATKTKKASQPCGYESNVTFGGGMFFEQLTGYCRPCKKFVYVSWTRENIPTDLKKQMKIKDRPKPKPLGEVWDSKTGEVIAIHACPTCKGPFMEIKKVDDLKFCPACNHSHFAIDKSKPMIAID
ncbi:MAG: hypothetical protein K9M57_08365 [Phycisphaerae bacterium]|nr:hypothetical protein [Phycisphaerae bacterium]